VKRMLTAAVIRQNQRHKKAIFCKKMGGGKNCGQLPEQQPDQDEGGSVQMLMHCRFQIIHIC
jgi:hypothetical protein